MIIPQQIGKYSISCVVGRGAMGVVYKGFDPHIRRTVAIKTIHKELLSDDETAQIAERFRNEAQAVGRLQHPGIVAIYEFGDDAKSAFIAMEFVEGRSLDQVLSVTPLLAEAKVLALMDQLLAALEYAHDHGVWHRDIKPANLIVTDGGQIKLTDFGIARIADVGLTQTASTIGSPGYMAPEQYIGEGVDHRADLFAAGVLLYRLLTGVAPFAGGAETIMYKVMNETPKPPGQVSPKGFASAYDALVEKALIKDAGGRFQSAPAFRQALRMAAHRLGTDRPKVLPEMEDATIIVASARRSPAFQDSEPALANTPFNLPAADASGAHQAPTANSPAVLDLVALSRIERALAGHVGPMAKMMVRQAARDCTDLGSLTLQVAGHITTAPERQRFIREALAAGSKVAPVTAGTMVRAQTSSAPSPNADSSAQLEQAATEPVTEALKAHAVAVLSRHLGPIARIVVKRASEKTQDRSKWVQLLVESAGDIDAALLRKELQSHP